MPKKWVIAPNGGVTNEPPWGSTLKIETGAENIMPTPLAGGQEISFAPQMIFLGLRLGGWAFNFWHLFRFSKGAHLLGHRLGPWVMK